MNLARIRSRARVGIAAPLVVVEAHLSNGLPSISLVGLPETAVKESKDRVRSAILNSGFEFPARRIVVNLAPAELPKEGGRFDLAVALAILVASGQIPSSAVEDYEFLGELGLDGAVRPIRGVLPASMAALKNQKQLVVPARNAQEALMPMGARVFAIRSLLELSAHLSGVSPMDFAIKVDVEVQVADNQLDLSEVRGQFQAKKALEIAAAGQHNLLFFGPPGTGKTLLASRLPGILPPLTDDQRLEVAAIHSIAGYSFLNRSQRPFRAPHHTTSGVALVGGGSNPKPGEISLAHSGVLFLDELPEFSRQVLDVLREPLENGEIVISRAARKVTYPAQFQLIAAMNPTPGGYSAEDTRSSHYTPAQIQKYLSRISGPFLDRIDMQVEVAPVSPRLLSMPSQEESSRTVQKRVLLAVNRQLERQGKLNARLGPAELEQHCKLSGSDLEYLYQVMERLRLSARSYHRILKVTRTIADLALITQPDRSHLVQAIGYRQLDKILK